ncbi:MAG: SH3 domain-containing protein [Caldilineaceae bacterium]|nr:SH3 domain-containing protein [Caldilineaceae bacterium]
MSGPSATDAKVGTVYKGRSLRLIGRTASSTWFKVLNIRESWIRADSITIQAGCTLPEIES